MICFLKKKYNRKKILEAVVFGNSAFYTHTYFFLYHLHGNSYISHRNENTMFWNNECYLYLLFKFSSFCIIKSNIMFCFKGHIVSFNKIYTGHKFILPLLTILIIQIRFKVHIVHTNKCVKLKYKIIKKKRLQAI